MHTIVTVIRDMVMAGNLMDARVYRVTRYCFTDDDGGRRRRRPRERSVKRLGVGHSAAGPPVIEVLATHVLMSGNVCPATNTFADSVWGWENRKRIAAAAAAYVYAPAVRTGGRTCARQRVRATGTKRNRE